MRLFKARGEAAVRGMNRDTWKMSVATGACHGDFRVPRGFHVKGAISQVSAVLFSDCNQSVDWRKPGPEDNSAGKTITGIDEAERLDAVVVFHAGTKINADGEIET